MKYLNTTCLPRCLRFAIFLLCSLASLWASSAALAGDAPSGKEKVTTIYIDEPAIKRIDRRNLVEHIISKPSPGLGLIEMNPPNFIWVSDTPDKSDKDAFYQVRLSNDKTFKGRGVMASGPIQRFVHNFHVVLKPGTYYWQYGKMKGKNVEWKEPIEFVVTGKERLFPAPPIAEILKNIPKSNPRFLATKDMIGNYVSEDFAQLLGADAFIAKVEKNLIGEKLPESLIYSDQDFLSKTKPENLIRVIGLRTKEIYGKESAFFIETLKAYILTGDKRFLKESVRRYEYLYDQYRQIDAKGFSIDFTKGTFKSINSLAFDVLHDYLDKEKLEEIKELLVEMQREDYEHFRYGLELRLHSSHGWQHHVRQFFEVSLILQDHVPEADEWIDYVYHLWLAKAPTGSRNDGGWFPGNSYFGANQETVFLIPYWISLYSDFNFFSQPWHQNVSKYHFYTAPVGHIRGGFGDGDRKKMAPVEEFSLAIMLATGNPYGQAYLDIAKSIDINVEKTLRIKDRFDWFIIPLLDKQKKSIPALKSIPTSMDFRDVGMVGLQNNPKNPKENLSIVFKSSPFGTFGHAQPSQNAFNIQYGGVPVFYRSGYYSSFADFHSLQSYTHTRAHNSILADGIGQVSTSDGYGWIPQHIGGDKIVYFSGDASSAYSGDILIDGVKQMASKWEVELTPENGFGNPGVTKFRRHCVFIKPSTFIIYDELEADKPVEWTWLLHSMDPMINDSGRIAVQTMNAVGVLDLFSNEKIQKNITDKFYAKADDWLNNGGRKGIEYVDHYHLHAKTTNKSKAARFVGIIQVKNLENPTLEPVQVNPAQNTWKVGNTVIRAELSPDKPARLVVVNEAEGVGVAAGTALNELEVNGKKYNGSAPGVSILIEGNTRKYAVDVLPDVVKYN